MELRLQFVMGLFLGVTLVGCAGAIFPYKYYTLDAKSYEGKLLGAEPKDDLDLGSCDRNKPNQDGCFVMPVGKFLEMKADYLRSKEDLINCQKGVSAKDLSLGILNQ